MSSAPEHTEKWRARRLRPLLQFSALVATTLTALWGIELLRRQDPFLRTLGNLPPELQNLELYLERPTLTLRDGTRTLATLQLDALEIERNRVVWRARTLRRAVLYDEQGKPIGVAHAQELLYNHPAKRLQIAGDPTLLIRRHPLGDTPLTVQTAQLSWDLRRQQLRAELPTHLRWREGQGTVQTLHWDIAAGIITLQQTELRVRSAGQQERAQPPREVQIRAGKTRLRKDHSEVTDLWLKDGDTIATAERADVYDRRSYALATGKLRLEDPRVDIEGKQLEIWYGENQKRALLRNQIRMRIKPRETQPPPEGEEEDEIEQAKRYPIDVTCNEIEYFYRRKVAYLRGNIKAVQQLPDGRTRTLTADEAEYDQEAERLTLKGNVVVDEPERIFAKTHIAIVTLTEGEEDIDLPEGFEGFFYPREDEEEASPPNGNR